MSEKKVTKKDKATQVLLNKNIKFGDKRFKMGESIELNESDYEMFLKAGVINE